MNKVEQRKLWREELINAMQKLTKQGFRCFIVKNSDYVYGNIITPSDNVLYVQWEWIGWRFSFCYVPSRNNGSGCRCIKQAFPEVNASVVLQNEQEGLAHARKLKATLFKSSKDFFDAWHRESLVEVLPE